MINNKLCIIVRVNELRKIFFKRMLKIRYKNKIKPLMKYVNKTNNKIAKIKIK